MKPKSIDEKLHIVMDSGCNDKPKSIDEDLLIVTDSWCNDTPNSIDDDLQVVTVQDVVVRAGVLPPSSLVGVVADSRGRCRLLGELPKQTLPAAQFLSATLQQWNG